jgi:hypothetical protein
VRVATDYRDGHYTLYDPSTTTFDGGVDPAEWTARNTVEISAAEWADYQAFETAAQHWHERIRGLANELHERRRAALITLTLTGLVKLVRPLGSMPQGAVGTVVHIYDNGEVCEVEFSEPKQVLTIGRANLAHAGAAA